MSNPPILFVTESILSYITAAARLVDGSFQPTTPPSLGFAEPSDFCLITEALKWNKDLNDKKLLDRKIRKHERLMKLNKWRLRERLKRPDCKFGASGFVSSNLTPPTKVKDDLVFYEEKCRTRLCLPNFYIGTIAENLKL